MGLKKSAVRQYCQKKKTNHYLYILYTKLIRLTNNKNFQVLNLFEKKKNEK